jgi:hypothetical protein
VVLELDGDPMPRDDICRDERKAKNEQPRDRRRRHEGHGSAHGFVRAADLTSRSRKLPHARYTPSLALSGFRSTPGRRPPSGRGGAALLLQALRLPLRSLGPSGGSLSGEDLGRGRSRLGGLHGYRRRRRRLHDGWRRSWSGRRRWGRRWRRLDRRRIRPRSAGVRRASVYGTEPNHDCEQDERARLEPPRQ